MAFIQLFRLDAVTLALEALSEVGGMTVSDCREFGRKREAEAGGALPRDGGERNGRPGDGKVLVWSLAQVIRIRTGETGISAL